MTLKVMMMTFHHIGRATIGRAIDYIKNYGERLKDEYVNNFIPQIKDRFSDEELKP